MAKRGMRFQTKLMLAMTLIIVLLTTTILYFTGKRFRESYTGRFEESFASQVDQINDSRAARSQEFLEISKKLAKHPYIVQSILDKDPPESQRIDFWKKYGESLNISLPGLFQKSGPLRNSGPGGASGGPGSGGLLNRISQISPNKGNAEALSKIGLVGVVDLEGNRYTLNHPTIAGAARKQKGRNKVQAKRPTRKIGDKSDYLFKDEQQIGFFEVESKSGDSAVQEMVFSPVKDPDSGEIIGHFVRGAPAETAAERFLERYQSQFSDSAEKLRSGIVVEDSFFSRNVKEDEQKRIASSLDTFLAQREAILMRDPSMHSGKREMAIDGSPHLVHYCALNPESNLPTAWQVMLVPLSELKKEIRDMRIRGAATGLAALLVGLGLALLLSRNLSVPIRDLSDGTQAIQDGNLDARVKVRSSDEIGQLAQSFNGMAEELKQKERYRELLNKVSDEAVAQAMISGSLDLELGGEMKEVSTLFCDIRGFTALTETMHPSEVIDMLNAHMTAMTRVVQQYYGVVDKFVGDEIMAVFGALKNYGNDTANAAACALKMIEERERLNQGLEQPIAIGIGIATGEVVAGCMGSHDRLNYTVLGARVNLAARLCSKAGPMEVVIDDQTHAAISDFSESRTLPGLELKGFSEATSAYLLERIKTGEASQPSEAVTQQG